MINRPNEIKDNLIKMLHKTTEEKIKESELRLKNLKQEASQAPGAMQSHHCGLKAEFSRLADGEQDKLNRFEQDFKILQNYKIKSLKPENVSLGSLIEVEYNSSDKKLYFIFPVCGGEIIKLENLNKEITVVTLSTPLGSELLDKEVGESIKIHDNNLKVVNIY